jgi:hypothetical protein
MKWNHPIRPTIRPIPTIQPSAFSLTSDISGILMLCQEGTIVAAASYLRR